MARLKLQETGLDKVVQAPDTTVNGLDQRSSELKKVKQDLATYCRAWTDEAKTSRVAMRALSKRLNAGDHMVTRLEGLQKGWAERMEESIGTNSAAQRDAAEKTAESVAQLATTGSEFLTKFDTVRRRALKEAGQE